MHIKSVKREVKSKMVILPFNYNIFNIILNMNQKRIFYLLGELVE